MDPQTRQNLFLGWGGGPENKTNDGFAANISRKMLNMKKIKFFMFLVFPLRNGNGFFKPGERLE